MPRRYPNELRSLEAHLGLFPSVTGTGESLLMALNQRDVTGELDGPGVELLG